MTNKIKLSESNKADMKREIRKYFASERDEDLGDLASELILDFFIEKLAPHIYNQGVEDAYGYMQINIEDLLALKVMRI